jgi:hypothetical protein
MKPILGLCAVIASAASLIAGHTPASAQYYFPEYNSRPTRSFTGYSGTLHNVYTPIKNYYGSHYGSSFDQPRRSNKGFGHSSGSYFGW